MLMKRMIIALILCIVGVLLSHAQAKLPGTTTSAAKEEQELLDLSKTKWQWMADKNIESLSVCLNASAQSKDSLNRKQASIIISNKRSTCSPLCLLRLPTRSPGFTDIHDRTGRMEIKRNKGHSR